MVSHHQDSDAGRVLVSSRWGRNLKSSSHGFGRCIKLLWLLGRAPRDHPKAHTSLCSGPEQEAEKCPWQKEPKGYAVKLSTPERALHRLAVQDSVVCVVLSATCMRVSWLYLHCIVLGLQPPQAPVCTKDTFITPLVFALPSHPWALESEITRAVVQPTWVFIIAPCWVRMLHALESSLRDSEHAVSGRTI